MSRSIASTTNNRQKYKIVFLGDQGVGKSCIIDRFINDRFDQNTNPTVGIDFMVRNLSYKNKNYRLQLWDTAGQERFRSLIPGYLKDALCAVFVCDATKPESTATLETWMSLFSQNKAQNAVSVVCSNKIDIATRFQLNQADREAKKFGLHHFKVSAKTGENVPEMFNGIIDLINKKSVEKQQKKLAVQPEGHHLGRVVEEPVAPVSIPISSEPISLSTPQTMSKGVNRQSSKCC